MITTVDQGLEFSRHVAELLSFAGYAVKGETLVGHKKVDLLAENVRFGVKRQRIAVECKAYATPLTKDAVAQIYADYLPLISSAAVDEVLLVTRNGLTATGNAFISDARGLIHVTIDELLLALMDFRGYLTHLIRTYESEPVSKYYVKLAAIDGRDLEDLVFDWISNEISRPLALLGSYGLGKTTFASYICSSLAQRALEDRKQRIPVLIRLADIASEQSLEGLLGKALTSVATVGNYSFPNFMMFNESGRLVIFLDGFDEMKHTLSWEAFKHNFAQLNRLITPKSRVILLGRPTAFLSDAEQQMALHGIRTFGDQLLRDPDWPDYEEVELSTFSRTQVEDFLSFYFSFRREEIDREIRQLQTAEPTSRNRAAATRLSTDLARLRELTFEAIEILSSKHLADIARRPVQLRMLADILPQWRGDINDLTTAVLYSEFIDLVIERELSKDSRLRFSKRVRREFARNLAWWMWSSSPSPHRITGESLPAELFSNYASPSEDIGDVRRDLVAACFLERKLGGALYWPHRSFQEFLVAEEIVARLDANRTLIDDISRYVTNEVGDFISGLISENNLRKWEPTIARHRGPLTWHIAKTLIGDIRRVDFVISRLGSSFNPWYVLLGAVACARHNVSTHKAGAVRSCILARLAANAKQVPSEDSTAEIDELGANTALCLLALIILAANRDDNSAVVHALISILSMRIHTVVGKEKRVLTVANPDAREVANKITLSRRRRTIDVGGLYTWFKEQLCDKWIISEWILGDTIATTEPKLPQKVSVPYLESIEEAIAAIRRPAELQSTRPKNRRPSRTLG